MPVRIVLADDHPIVLTGLEQLLALEEDFIVLARCTNGEEAVAAVRRHRPDVLLLDLQMPEKDGLAVLRELQNENLPTRVIMLTASLGERELLEAIRLGARGIILKEMAPDLMIRGVRTVHAGGQWLEPGAVSRALDRLMHRDARAQEVAGLLTPRELAIVRMVAQGLQNKQIARELEISEGTVKNHLYNIYQKVGVNSRVALVRYAQEHELI